MKQVLMVVLLLCVLPVESGAQALLRCDTSPDGGIKVRNFSVTPSAVGMARVGDDCLAAVMALLGTDPENSDMDVSFEVRSVGTEVSFIVLLVPEDDEQDNDGDDGGDNGDNGGGDNGDNGNNGGGG